MTTPLIFREGIGSSSWQFTAADGTTHLLTLAHVPGWVLSAPDAELRWTPVPTIEVRTRASGASTYRTVRHLDIAGATKRRIPWDAAQHVADAYYAAQTAQG
ncbi:hypothetical protein KO481_16935 [Nocardia sp. NEAU-G5]|uniref:Uncharacterized protein n=1 Tax=Nocardia albiluteola TaxID=2842303 RepID=A0ABS6AYT6_9NOCA|nr:hypothetical protein [Nocardia albiluteola]MBU3063207.1 hypothetical protein [Nocardia albiluteola]